MVAAAAAKDEKKTSEGVAGKEVEKSFAEMSRPEGDRIDQPSLDGWFKPEAGNGFYGKLLSHFQVKDKKGVKRDVIIVGLLVACEGIDAETKKKVMLKRGQYLGVSVRAKLDVLMDYVSTKSIVFVKTLNLATLKSGQTMWNFEIVPEKGATVGPRPAPRQLSHDEGTGGGAGGDDDIPF